MRWLGLLPHAWRLPDPRPLSVVPMPIGMDHLRAHVGLSESTDQKPVATALVAGEAVGSEALQETAAQAQKCGHWAEAERLWRALREQSPDICFAYTGGAAALSGLGRGDEARSLLSVAATRFPREHSIHHELGHLAGRQGNWRAAEAHWREALTLNVRP